MRKTLSKEDYLKATRDPTRSIRQINSGKKIHPKVYQQFKSWIEVQLGYKVRQVTFKKHSNSTNEPCKISSGEEDVEKEDIDLRSLEPEKWLDDIVINEYMALITERSKIQNHLPLVFAFDTHFFQWTRKKCS